MFLQTAEGPIYYETIDLTPPWLSHPETIVFCHGVATTCDVWSEWLPVLASKYRIVRFDTRGFGRSASAAPPGFTWSFDKLADDIAAVARAAGAERFHLIGESAGGTASLVLACRKATPVLTLSCASTAHRGTGLDLVKNWRANALSNGTATWSSDMMEKRFFPENLSAEKAAWYHQTQSESPAESFIEVGELLLRTDLSDQLSNLAIPLLLLVPESSPFVTITLSNEFREKVPHSQMEVFRRSKHGLPFSHGRQCAETVLDFLAQRKSTLHV